MDTDEISNRAIATLDISSVIQFFRDMHIIPDDTMVQYTAEPRAKMGQSEAWAAAIILYSESLRIPNVTNARITLPQSKLPQRYRSFEIGAFSEPLDVFLEKLGPVFNPAFSIPDSYGADMVYFYSSPVKKLIKLNERHATYLSLLRESDDWRTLQRIYATAKRVMISDRTPEVLERAVEILYAYPETTDYNGIMLAVGTGVKAEDFEDWSSLPESYQLAMSKWETILEAPSFLFQFPLINKRFTS
jgi:hypothetical protein